MYLGLMCGIVIVSAYFAVMAIVHHFNPCSGLFSGRSTAVVILGAILGIPLVAAFGRIGTGIGIALMWFLFYTEIINWLIERIPENIRRNIRRFLHFTGISLTILVIIVISLLVLRFIGV